MKKVNKITIASLIFTMILVGVIVFLLSSRLLHSKDLYYPIRWGASMDEAKLMLELSAGTGNVLVDEDDAVIEVFKQKYLGEKQLYAHMTYFFTKGKLSFISVGVDDLSGKGEAQLYVDEKKDSCKDNIDISYNAYSMYQVDFIVSPE